MGRNELRPYKKWDPKGASPLKNKNPFFSALLRKKVDSATTRRMTAIDISSTINVSDSLNRCIAADIFFCGLNSVI